jgi:hypothetical protein
MKNTEPAKFMTTSESFRKLLLAHFEGDAEAFRVAAREYIEEERRITITWSRAISNDYSPATTAFRWSAGTTV